MKKALLVTTVSGFVPQFEMNNVRILQQMGYEVHYASNYHTPSYGKDNHRLDGTGIIRHQVDFVRSPYSLKNRTVFLQLKEIMQKEQFRLVHCHTPMGGVMTRLAAHATKTGPVIYTAHGFHFYKGASLVNWLCYYPMERWLSRFTDEQICINVEDYQHAQRFKARRVDYIPGAGIDLDRVRQISVVDVNQKKAELGIDAGKKVLLSAGELIKRKNHETIIKALAKIQDLSVIYVICGHGELDEYLHELAKSLGVENQVRFLGYRSDILELYKIADLYVFPSYQEGLPMALLEAMASGLPVVCSDIRGSRDLMEADLSGDKTVRWKQGSGGAMVREADDVEAYAEAIRELLKNKSHLSQCGQRNWKEAEKFSSLCVEKKMREIYSRVGKPASTTPPPQPPPNN